MDFLISILLLILLSPVLLVIAILVRIKLGKPVFFNQERPGKGGKLFRLHKFRSMGEAFDASGKLLPEDQRLTPLGRFLRSTSLDELPELFNVLKGEMSLVGPRPLLPAYLKRYSPEQARRHEVLPGITGWAQVNGRNILSWEDRFKLDVWYVDNRSFWLDLKILWLTFWKTIGREGINAAGNTIMPEFMGNQDTESTPNKH